ncbi:TPA: hypothetical protein ACGX4V_002125 [Enterococcus faecalis]|nr:hypothetical protein [Enterococcus faecalis]
MSKLADYGINVKNLSNVDTVRIDGHDFPIVLSHEAIEYIGIVYGDDYTKFEADLNDFLERSEGEMRMGNIKSNDWKIIKSLVYGMLCAGGLEETPQDVFAWLGMRNETVEVFGKCMKVFSKNTFQVEDVKKSKKPQDYQPTQKKATKKRKKNKRK